MFCVCLRAHCRAAVRYTSRMHRMWYTHQHYTIRAAPGSSTRAVDLLRRLLSMISSWLIRHTDSRSKEGAAPFEAFWEAELYRVGVQSTIKGTVVSVQAGKVRNTQCMCAIVEIVVYSTSSCCLCFCHNALHALNMPPVLCKGRSCAVMQQHHVFTSLIVHVL
jgi:hypothetical protein